MMDYAKELEVAKTAAREAGEIMEEYHENGFEISRKSAYSDLVTEADMACQDAIIDIIRESFPDDGFLAEENDQIPDGQNRVWVIDPIDGTRNYTHGFPMYCTSIALKVDGESVVGVVYAPRLDELFSAVRGEGAWLNGEPIQVSHTDEMRDALVIARISDYTPAIRDMETDLLRSLLEQGASFRRPGTAALDMCMVACGRMDGHVLLTINEWDIAAGRLIVKEADGAARVRDAAVGDYLELVASNGNIQEKLVTFLDADTG